MGRTRHGASPPLSWKIWRLGVTGLASAHRRAGKLVRGLTVLDPEAGAATPFSDEELARLLVIQSAVGRVFANAASRTGAELMRSGASFHPNERGLTAIELARVLGS